MKWTVPDLGATGHSVQREPSDQPLGRTPFYEQQRRQGAVFGKRMNWQQPFHYGDAIDEHHRIRQTCGVIDSSSQSKFLIIGPDAERTMQTLFTADMNTKIGRGVFSCLCNPLGGAIDDAVCWRLASQQWWCIGSTAGRVTTRAWIEQQIHASRHRTYCIDQTDAFAYIAIQGPQSRDVLSRLTREDLSTASLPFLNCRRIEVAGVEMLVGRCGYSGELGYELYAPMQFADWTWERVCSVAEDFGGGPCGIDALVSCGFEKGFTSLGPDYHARRSPVAGGIGFTVADSKAYDFIGREALLDELQRGPAMRVRGFVSDDPSRTAKKDAVILAADHPIGRVLWGRWAPTVKVSYGRCVIDAAYRTGDAIQISDEADPIPALLCRRYLYDPSHTRMKV